MHIAQERQDDVRGVVIGGDYVGWQVMYEDRPQSGKYYASTAEDAKAAGRERIADLKSVNCGAPCYLYPDPTLWTIRLWGG